MDIIKTATGKAFRTDYVTYAPDSPYAYIRILGQDFVKCATIFSNPIETQTIEYGEFTLEGYTNLMSISAEGDAIRVQLSK